MCETIELLHGHSACHIYIGNFHEDILEIKQFYFWGICLLYKNKKEKKRGSFAENRVNILSS
jgi:hypothetical protein